MTILFSPVGTADPATHLGDGPMVHIVRHRRPELVVLYLSPDMARHEQADGRYSRAIAYLFNSLSCGAPQVKTVVSDYEEVYRFDHYIDEFDQFLSGISAEYPDEQIIVNASSGTPAMEQALVALGAFGRISLQLLQVLTPRAGANKKDDREDPDNYDFDFMMELSNEVEADRGYASRIVEVRSPHFYDRLLRENIVALVDSYEYAAAYELAEKTSLISSQAKEMILASAERLNLDGQRAASVFGGTPLACKRNDPLAEYLYGMEVRYNQGRWADFLRAMTPAFTEVMKQILKRSGLRDVQYMQMRKGSPTGKCDPEKIKKDARLSRLFDLRHDRPSFITNHTYENLVNDYCSNRDVVERVSKLRRMEEEARNKLAHEIRGARRESLEKEGGMSMREVLDAFIYLHDWANPSQPMDIGLYRRISDEIISRL